MIHTQSGHLSKSKFLVYSQLARSTENNLVMGLSNPISSNDLLWIFLMKQLYISMYIYNVDADHPLAPRKYLEFL